MTTQPVTESAPVVSESPALAKIREIHANPPKPHKSRLTNKPGHNLITPTGNVIPAAPIIRYTYDRKERDKYTRFGVPSPILKPVDFDASRFSRELDYNGPYGAQKVTKEKQLKTINRIIDTQSKKPWLYVIQTMTMVNEAKQFVLYGLHQKKIPFQWFKISEYGNNPIQVPEGCKAVVLHNMSDIDHHRKIEKVRDILCEVPSDCMVFIITEGRGGVEHFSKHFGRMINGGIINFEFVRQATFL